MTTIETIRPNIRLKWVYDPPANEDGRRVLATRYWPRGIRRTAVDEYVPQLAPSRQLLHAFKRGDMKWETFQPRYLEEMNGDDAQKELVRLAALATSGTITLLCVCRDDRRCHRLLLRNLVLSSLVSHKEPQEVRT